MNSNFFFEARQNPAEMPLFCSKIVKFNFEAMFGFLVPAKSVDFL